MKDFLTSITQSFEFDSGHRILGHENKCKHLHGHRYRAEVTLTSPKLDSLGRIIDFGVVKEKIKTFIDDVLDHNMILHIQDPILDGRNNVAIFGDKQPVVLNCNPTAENLAMFLFDVIAFIFKGKEVNVVEVTLWETPNCRATARHGSNEEIVWAMSDAATRHSTKEELVVVSCDTYNPNYSMRSSKKQHIPLMLLPKEIINQKELALYLEAISFSEVPRINCIADAKQLISERLSEFPTT